jgi:hypothetical protein
MKGRGGVRRFKLGRRWLAATCVGVATFAVATAVEASIPDGSGTIHACYSKASNSALRPGTLRVIDTGLGQSCRADEVGLDWNRRGVTGPTGTRGPTGPTGRDGSSHAYEASNPFVPIPTGPAVPVTTVTSLALPPGNYDVTATGDVTSHVVSENGPDEDVDCSLDPNQFSFQQIAVTSSTTTPYAVNGLISLPEGGTVDLDCFTPDTSVGTSVDMADNHLIAVAVGAVD